MSPDRRNSGGRPADRCRSEAPRSIISSRKRSSGDSRRIDVEDGSSGNLTLPPVPEPSEVVTGGGGDDEERIQVLAFSRPEEEKARLLALTFRIVVARHRIGVIDGGMQRKILEARAEFRRQYAGREEVVEFFEPDRFSSALSIQDNILFGRVAFEQANAQTRISALVREVAGDL